MAENQAKKFSGSPVLSERSLEAARINNQFVLSATNPSVSDANRIYFLELVVSDASGFTITDGGSNVITGTIAATGGTTLQMDHSPLRLDGGFTLTGTILCAKAFWVDVNNPGPLSS